MAGGLDEKKRQLRKHFKHIRAALPQDERTAIDEAIQARVAGLPEFEQADVVLTYLAFGTEIETRQLIATAWDCGKAVALPWCVPHTRKMRWFAISDFSDLVTSSFGVDEPRPDPAHEQLLTTGERMVCIVPGLTFDERRYRMGYGGGFYDTLLETFMGASVGLCREAQLSPRGVEALDVHDKPVDIVVTESRVIRVV